MAHTLPPARCATNTTTFEDFTLTANVTLPRKIHIDELRTAINDELTRRGLSSATWTDLIITANASTVRKIHVDELRTQIAKIHSGDNQSGYCPGDTVTISWAVPTLTINSTKIGKSHWEEMRTTINALKTSCICETEQCKYCVDCGYQYFASCGFCKCNDRCSSDGPSCPEHWVYLCGSINTVAGTNYPFKSWNGTTSVTWDGTVPWNWGDSIPGTAIAWRSPHDSWSCKCDPYTWSA